MSPDALLRRLRLHGGLWLWRYGGVWLAVALVLGAWLAVELLLLPPARLAVAQGLGELARLRTVAAQAASRPQPQAAPDPLLNLQQALAGASDPTGFAASLARLAQAHGIELLQSDYQQQALAQTGLQQFQVTQPVRASYPQLRAYLLAVLAEHPQASLDALAARRDSARDTVIEARLRWSLWQAPGPLASTASANTDRAPTGARP